MNLLEDLKENVIKSINEIYENAKKQQNKIKRIFQDMKIEIESTKKEQTEGKVETKALVTCSVYQRQALPRK